MNTAIVLITVTSKYLLRDTTHILSVNELLNALIKRLCEIERHELNDQSTESIVEVTLNEIANATQRPFTVIISSHDTIYRIYDFIQESNPKSSELGYRTERY